VKFRLNDHAEPPISLKFAILIPCALSAIVFFMLTFHDARDDALQRGRLPGGGELARPLAEASSRSVSVQLTGNDTVIVGADEVPLQVAKLLLERERSAIREKKICLAPSVVIFADSNMPTGKVQELILIAQQAGFERILLEEREKLPTGVRDAGRKRG